MPFLKFALPDKHLKPIDLARIQRSKSGNDYLLADLDSLVPNGPAVASALSVAPALAALKTAAYALGAAVREETPGGLFLIWRSPTLKFPNSAQAYVAPHGAGTRVSFFGRAGYGTLAFGANRGFIRRWAAAL